MENRNDQDKHSESVVDGVPKVGAQVINASGHVQELHRNFSLLSLVGIGLVCGSVWPAIAGSILTSIFNGGPPGALYEYIVVSVFYFVVAVCIAELASAIPSSGGVYHWASITGGPRWGRVIGFFAGWWNYLAWVFGAASMSSIFGNNVVQMYALTHPNFTAEPWHVFIVYILVTWIACLLVCFFNRAMPHLNNIGIFILVAGFFITIIVITVTPGHDGRPTHATSSFVWTEWTADIGYSNGFTFVAGMLNGAYSIGTPDVVSHLAEEIPYPQRNVPLAIGVQMAVGFTTGLCFLIALMYSIHDYNALFNSPFPIAEIYSQATGSAAGAIGLLTIILLSTLLTIVSLYITSGRALWALSRDRATPFPNTLKRVNQRLGMPFNSTITTTGLVTILGCIYVGSKTAFNAFVGSFVLMSTSSYTAAILPNLLTGRKHVNYGPFKLKGLLGVVLNLIACAYMMIWFVIYCFPFALPTTAATMNYACLIWGGLTIFVATWWLIGARKNYEGPTATGGIITEAEMVANGKVPANYASSKA